VVRDGSVWSVVAQAIFARCSLRLISLDTVVIGFGAFRSFGGRYRHAAQSQMSYVVLIAVFAVDRAFSGRRVVASAAARWLLESVSLKFVSLATRGEGERRKPHVRCMWCSHSLEATPVRVDVLV